MATHGMDQSRLLQVPGHLIHLVSLPPRSFALLLQLLVLLLLLGAWWEPHLGVEVGAVHFVCLGVGLHSRGWGSTPRTDRCV
jgi:hypothetical protein